MIRIPNVVMLAVLAAVTGSSTATAETTAVDSLQWCDAAHVAGNLEGSEAIAREILAREPGCAAAAWRLSRALIGRSNRETAVDPRRELLREARRWAETAVDYDPQGSQGHTCLAICAGNLSGLAGGRRRLELAEEARGAAEKAIDLDETNDLAWLVLGVWHREVASIRGLKKVMADLFFDGLPTGASLKRSEVCLRRAVALAPSHINHHRELGITLMSLERYGEAAAAFERAVALPAVDPGDPSYQADARARLERARALRDAPPDQGLY